jgi:hypothetical protein
MDNFNKTFSVEPSQSSARELTWKFFIWLIIWGIISVLLFIILSFVGSTFTESMWQAWWFVNSNPILPLLLLLIGFLSSFIWNLATAGIYGLFFGQRYYNIWKTMWLLLLTNWLLFVIFAPIYLIFSSDINILFIVLWFHVMFSIFLSSNQIEIVSNPNYSASSLIGTTLWFSITILIYSLIRKTSMSGWTQEKLYLMLLFPSIIWFSIIPLWLGIREAIYHKMYEMWNNGFYTASIVEETRKDNTSNIEFNSPIDEDSDINIDLN